MATEWLRANADQYGTRAVFDDQTSCQTESYRRGGRSRQLMLCSTLVDEVGYLNYDNRYADLLFEVVTRTYLTSPVLITTNKPFSEWADVFSSAACVVTLVDRLVHRSEIVQLDGESYRLREARAGRQTLQSPLAPNGQIPFVRSFLSRSTRCSVRVMRRRARRGCASSLQSHGASALPMRCATNPSLTFFAVIHGDDA